MKARCCQTVFTVLWFLVVLSPGAAVAGEDRPSHCTANEKTIFACAKGAKLLSICASKDFSATSGYLQYRFGPKGAPELSWPPTSDRSRKDIEVGQSRWARGIVSHVRFKKGNYHYIVYEDFGEQMQSGVVVQKDGKKIASLVCNDDPFSDLQRFVVTKYGLTVNNEDEFTY